MKRTLNILLILGFSVAFAQEKNTGHTSSAEAVYSIYFTEKSLGVLKQTATVTSTYFNTYQLENTPENQVRIAAGEFLHVDASGIYFEKNKLLFITREQVREDGKYQVRDGYLFGVVEGDSLPTALEGENYYFLVPAKTYLYNMKSGQTTLFEGLNAGEYLLVSPEEEAYYSAIYLQFNQGSVKIKELVFNSDACGADAVNDKEVIKGDFNTYLLSPTLQEWKSLFNCFVTYDAYVVRN